MLPTIQETKHAIKLIGLGKEIFFRPFKVKEQKILLEAKQSATKESYVQAIYAIIQNCTFSAVNPNHLSTFDVEDLFLRIRSKSVGEEIELKYNFNHKDEHGEDAVTPIKVTVNLDDVKVVTGEEHTTLLEFTEDGFALEMKYPTFKAISMVKTENEIIASCIKNIIQGDHVTSASDYTQAEMVAWLDELESRHLLELQRFFTTMPTIKHEQEVKLPNGETKTIKLKGLDDFF